MNIKACLYIVISCFAFGSCHSQNATDYFAEKMEALILNGEAAGLEVYITHNDTVVIHETWGYSNIETKTPLRKNSIYNIRSMTKPMAAVVAHRFIERGLLKISDKVSRHLEYFRNEKTRNITVEQLLHHRAGYEQGQPGKSWRQHSSLTEMTRYWAKQGPTVFSTAWSYADAHADIVGSVLEEISGKPMSELYREELFKPLGLENTFSIWERADINKINPLHYGSKDNWEVIWKPEEGQFYPFAMCAQSVFSSVKDYEKFIRLFINKGKAGNYHIIQESSIDSIFINRNKINVPSGIFPILDDKSLYYRHFWGMAFEKNEIEKNVPFVFMHQGSDGTAAYGFPNSGIVVIIMTQSRGTSILPKIEQQLLILLDHKSI